MLQKLILTRNIYFLAANSRKLSYKSDLALENLYPGCKQFLFTPPPPPQLQDDKFNGYIPINELEIQYSRSSGPGGQNVNCVSTKVDLRVNVSKATFIHEAVKSRILEDYKNQINKDGQLVIRSDVTRSQQMNLADALEKLRGIIRAAEIPKMKEISAETQERIRKRQLKAASVRLHVKRERSQIKTDRQGF